MSTQPMSTQVAKALSRVFHPFIITAVTLAVVAYLAEPSVAGALKWTGIYLGVVIAPSLLLLIQRTRNGSITDIDVTVREHRFLFYGVGIASFLGAIALLWWLDAPRTLMIFVVAATLSNSLSVVINRFTKVSVHSAAMAGCTAILLFLLPTWGIVMIGITLLMGWARVKLGKHTVNQVLLGWLAAGLSVAVVFGVYP